MSKIYMAGRFSRRHELHALGKELERHGHTIVSRWTLPDTDHVLPAGMSAQAADAERLRFAQQDVEDILKADWCISLQEEPRGDGRGGRHVEFGLAMALGRRLISIGPRETVFHHLPQVEHFDTVTAFLGWLPGPKVPHGLPPVAPVINDALDRTRKTDLGEALVAAWQKRNPAIAVMWRGGHDTAEAAVTNAIGIAAEAAVTNDRALRLLRHSRFWWTAICEAFDIDEENTKLEFKLTGGRVIPVSLATHLAEIDAVAGTDPQGTWVGECPACGGPANATDDCATCEGTGFVL